MTNYEEVKTAFLALPWDQQQQMYDELVVSMEEDAASDELARRVEEVRNGTADLVGMDEVRSGIREIQHEMARQNPSAGAA